MVETDTPKEEWGEEEEDVAEEETPGIEGAQ
jgi:hypothetical protein